MNKEGKGQLMKQQQDEGRYKGIIKAKEPLKEAQYAELQMLNMKYSYSSHSVSTTANTPTRSSMLQEAFADEQEIAVSLRASKLLQILRRWRALTRRRQVRKSTRSSSCSRLPLVPLVSCVSIHLHSDDEDEDDNREGNNNFFTSDRSRKGPTISSCLTPPRRALSCPKLISSPLSSCTPFSNIHCDEQHRDEELESCLHSAYNYEESGINGKASSPSKLLSRHYYTPKGYLALYVGQERKRFLVKANLLNHPLFGVLLEKAKEEFGFEQKGPLNIPCEIAFFQHIMLLVESNDPSYKNPDHSTILLHLNPAHSLATSVV